MSMPDRKPTCQVCSLDPFWGQMEDRFWHNNNLHNFQLSIVLILSKYQIEIILNSLNDKSLHFQCQIVVSVEDLQVCMPLVKYI